VKKAKEEREAARKKKEEEDKLKQESKAKSKRLIDQVLQSEGGLSSLSPRKAEQEAPDSARSPLKPVAELKISNYVVELSINPIVRF